LGGLIKTEREIIDFQPTYCERCHINSTAAAAAAVVSRADYIVLLKETDTSQDYEQEEVLHLCLFCTHALFLSKEGKKVKNYIRISNVLPAPPVFHEFEKINYNHEKQDIFDTTISLETPFVDANGKIGVMLDKIMSNLNEVEDKEVFKNMVEMLFERMTKRKYELGKHPIPS
jgi:hypothetical protein